VGPDDVVLADDRRLGRDRRAAGRRARRPPGRPGRGREHQPHHVRGPDQYRLGYRALALAFLALYWRRLPLLRRGYEPGAGLTAPIQRLQSGVINDYVTWIVLGLAAIGGALALIIRQARPALNPRL
jgi:hypothetical protein